jgi:hypothetical protein
VLAHKGQTVDADGTVTGPAPQTNTLGFRWTVVNSVLNPGRLRDVAGTEWRAKRAANEDAAERDVCQSQWALPAKPDAVDLSQLDYVEDHAPAPGKLRQGRLSRRHRVHRRRVRRRQATVPLGGDRLPRRRDAARRRLRPSSTSPRTTWPRRPAILCGLRDWRDDTSPRAGAGRRRGEAARRVIIDGGYKPVPVFQFVGRERRAVRRHQGLRRHPAPRGEYKRETGSKVVGDGEHYNLVQRPDGRQFLEVATDKWKSWLHARLKTPIDQPGAMTLFDPGIETGEHLSFAKHLTSEKQVEEFEPGQGTVTKWEAVSRQQPLARRFHARVRRRPRRRGAGGRVRNPAASAAEDREQHRPLRLDEPRKQTLVSLWPSTPPNSPTTRGPTSRRPPSTR